MSANIVAGRGRTPAAAGSSISCWARSRPMTEQEWLACTDPRAMLKQVRFRSHKRKSRLFAVACCRCVWRLLVDERSREAVEVAERHADGQATDEELRAAAAAAHTAHDEMFYTLGKVGASVEWAAEFCAAPHA